jgi:NitT/TauT family transport system substrate-binding protein
MKMISRFPTIPPRPARRLSGPVLLGVCLLLVTGGCRRPPAESPAGTPDTAMPPVVFLSDWLAQPEHGGFYQAKTRGFYHDAGLDVTLIPGGPNSYGVQKVALGKVQFSIGRIDDVLTQIHNGVPLLIVAPQMQHDPQAIMVHESSPVRSLADLDGHAVMASPGTVFLKLVEQRYHIKLKVLPLDYGLARFVADPEFVQQTYITSDPYILAQQGVKIRLFLISESGYDPYRVIFTRRDFAAQHPAAVRAFVAASLQGWESYMAENTDRTAADHLLQEQNPKMKDQDFIEFDVKTMRDHLLVAGDPARGERLGLFDWARLQENIEFMHQAGMIPNLKTPEGAVTLEFLPEPLRAEAERRRAQFVASHK